MVHRRRGQATNGHRHSVSADDLRVDAARSGAPHARSAPAASRGCRSTEPGVRSVHPVQTGSSNPGRAAIETLSCVRDPYTVTSVEQGRGKSNPSRARREWGRARRSAEARDRPRSPAVEVDTSDARNSIEAQVAGQQRGPCRHATAAIRQSSIPRGVTPSAPHRRWMRGRLEISGRLERQQREPGEQPAKVVAPRIPRPGQDLHRDRFRDAIGPSFVAKRLGRPLRSGDRLGPQPLDRVRRGAVVVHALHLADPDPFGVSAVQLGLDVRGDVDVVDAEAGVLAGQGHVGRPRDDHPDNGACRRIGTRRPTGRGR